MAEDCNVDLTAFNKIHSSFKMYGKAPWSGGLVYFVSDERGQELPLSEEEFEFLGKPDTIDILITPTPRVKNG